MKRLTKIATGAVSAVCSLAVAGVMVGLAASRKADGALDDLDFEAEADVPAFEPGVPVTDEADPRQIVALDPQQQADAIRDATALISCFMRRDIEGMNAITAAWGDEGAGLLLGVLNIAASTVTSFALSAGVDPMTMINALQVGSNMLGDHYIAQGGATSE